MNRLARYRAQGGQRFVVIPRPHSPHDILESLPYWRKQFLRQRKAGHDIRFTEYGWTLKLAMKPVTLPRYTPEPYIERLRRKGPMAAAILGPVFDGMVRMAAQSRAA